MIKTKKVFLFNPPVGKYSRSGRCQMDTDTMTVQPARIPIELCYIAAIFMKQGYEAKIVDYPLEKKGWDVYTDDIKKYRPDCIIFSVTTFTIDKDIRAIDILKKIKPEAQVIVTGEHLSNQDIITLRKYKNIDIAARNEVEEIMDEIAAGKELKDIKGITYRDGKRVIRNSDAPPVRDLDALPFPARNLLNKFCYLRPDTKEPITLIMTGRGCPYQCIFCTAPKISNSCIRQRDPIKVVDEIEECVNKEHIRAFFFFADTFTFKEKWVIELCQEIVRRGLRIEWGCNSRVDTFSEERAKWMKKAGCYVIGFGIESGNQKTLDKTRKGTKVEDAVKAIKICKKHKIKSYMLFMIGFPWETKKMIEETLNFAVKLDGDFLDINIPYPFYDTELFTIMKKEGIFTEMDLAGHDATRPLAKTKDLSTNDLIKLRKKGILMFYVRPRYILRTIVSVKSPKVFLNYLRSGLKLLAQQIKTKKIE